MHEAATPTRNAVVLSIFALSGYRGRDAFAMTLAALGVDDAISES